MNRILSVFKAAALFMLLFSCKKSVSSPTDSSDNIIASSINDATTTLGRQSIITLQTGDYTYPTSKALLWMPDTYKKTPSKNKTYPLVINLYGQEQCGADLNYLLKGNTMSEYIANGFNPAATNPVNGKKYDFFVFNPQCPVAWGWSSSHIYTMLEQLKKNYPIDTTRIYLTGFSAGGWGLWSCITDNDKLARQIAAIVPISSGAADNPKKLSNVAKFNIACLNICGDQDAFYTNAVRYTKLINNSNPQKKAKLVTLHNVGHIAWKYAYDASWTAINNMNIYEWMLKQKRAK